jgi:hypothetical protein
MDAWQQESAGNGATGFALLARAVSDEAARAAAMLRRAKKAGALGAVSEAVAIVRLAHARDLLSGVADAAHLAAVEATGRLEPEGEG